MAASKAQQQEFLSRIVPLVQKQRKLHGYHLYASITIGQAIWESGWGTAPKMVAANAMFGVKVGRSAYKFGTAWKGAAYKTGTTEYYDGVNATRITDFFRQYDSVEDSICDYMDMLQHCQRYKAALDCDTPKRSIEAIVAGGYATGPEYAKHIIDLVNKRNLTQYDVMNITPVNPYKEVSKLLKRGDRSEGVKYLQWILNNRGFNCGAIDGCFGPATENAVRLFQKSKNIEIDGIVGKVTWSKLKEV